MARGLMYVRMKLAAGTSIVLRTLPSPPAIVHPPDHEKWEVMHPRDQCFYDADGGYQGTASVPPWAMSILAPDHGLYSAGCVVVHSARPHPS